MSFVTAAMYCPCSAHPLGNYGNGCETPEQRMARFTARTDRQMQMFGPENYQQHYGESYMLGFPSFNGTVYVQTLPAHDYPVPANYQYGLPPGIPLVLVGNTTSPYFHILPAPRITAP